MHLLHHLSTKEIKPILLTGHAHCSVHTATDQFIILVCKW